jgi:hypothetical protein
MEPEVSGVRGDSTESWRGGQSHLDGWKALAGSVTIRCVHGSAADRDLDV